MATVDGADIAARRKAPSDGIVAYLHGVKPSDLVVGFAYSINGDVRSVRYFANHKLFSPSRRSCTAAMDAITAEVALDGKPAPSAPLSAAVVQFVDDVMDASVKEQRATPALNLVVVRESKTADGSSTVLKPAQPTAKPKAVSCDITAR
jgi:hypothetical protein